MSDMMHSTIRKADATASTDVHGMVLFFMHTYFGEETTCCGPRVTGNGTDRQSVILGYWVGECNAVNQRTE